MKIHTRFLLAAIVVLLTFSSFAQDPGKMSYQALVRDSENKLVQESIIGFKVTILQGSAEGTVVYEEVLAPQTNMNGLITVEIGGAAGFDQIDWSAGSFFLKTEIDLSGGSSYSITGTSQLLSVPFAKHAATSGKAASFFDGNLPGEMLFWNGEQWIIIPAGEHDQVLRFCFGIPTWGPCPEIVLYKLNLMANPIDGGTTIGGGEYKEGITVEISATPNEGYRFVEWVDEDGVSLSTNSTHGYKMPAEETDLTALFIQSTDGGYGAGLTDIEGNSYKSVFIGNQEWMAENLKTKKFADGSAIDLGISIEYGEQTITPAYAIYNYPIDQLTSDEVLNMFGALYNWYAVNDPRGLCPAGWRVPTQTDWSQLVNYLKTEYSLHNDMYSSNINGVGNALKSCRQVNSPLGGQCNTTQQPRWHANNTHYGNDLINFNALPGGTISDHAHSAALESSFWWSATSEDADNAKIFNLFIETGALVNFNSFKYNALSVRCIKM